MVSLSEKRFSDVDDSTDYSNEGSDYEIHNKVRSYNVMEIERKRCFSSKVTNRSAGQESNYGKRFNNNNCNRAAKKQKCFSKNALMARENRLKKKLYVQNLEDTVEKYRDENKKLSSIVDNQSTVIEDLRKEVKYLKNVLTNSTDIGRLLKSINQNMQMSVPSQLNDKVKCHNTSIVTDASNGLVHPWSECKSSQEECIQFDCNSLHGECPMFPLSEFEQDTNWNDLFSELHSAAPIVREDAMCELPSEENIPNCLEEKSYDEHNYTSKLSLDNAFEDAGVCLHIAKHKVSLELCSSCSEQAWKED